MKAVYEDVSPLDQKCYQEYHLSEDLLMEHAALGLKSAIPKATKSILILAGPGNNGADGIALARMLEGEDKEVSLYLPLGAKSPMAQLQLKRAQAVGVKITTTPTPSDVIVDALFGSGLARPLSENISNLIAKINQYKSYKIACDIPTGIDLKGAIAKEAFIADITVTMGGLKYALFSDMAKDYTGEIRCVDLGVSSQKYGQKSSIFLLEESELVLPMRYKNNCHKGSFGHLNVVCGKKAGAAIIAAQAAYAFGTGLVTVIENEPYALPYELMRSSTLSNKASALCIGMGLGNQYDNHCLKKFLLDPNIPLLIDADLFYQEILNEVLAQKKEVVLTPHPKEFGSLLKILNLADVTVKEIQNDRFGYVRLFSQHYPDTVLLLKGANSLIAHQENIYIQPLGSNILSKGGSGDVLGGIIGALLAQGYSPLDAAISGSIAHALSAKNFTKNNYALTPYDLIEGIKCL